MLETIINTFKSRYLKEQNGAVFKNMVFLIITQLVNYVLPLLTMKYLLVTVGVSYFGKISFAQAFIGYFIVVVDYGFNMTATRDIARCADDRHKVVNLFVNVLYAKLALLFVCTLIMVALVFSFERFRADANIYLLFWGVVVGSCLFPQWFFQGIQKMGYITVINAIIKTLLLLLIFAFVKRASDYIYVPLLYSLSFILPSLYALLLVRKYCNTRWQFSVTGIKKALHDGFSIFISSAMSLVLNGSTVFILGLLATDAITGYYSGFDKLTRSCVMLFVPITTAIYPHVSQLLKENRARGVNYIKKVGLLTVVAAIVVALAVDFSSPLLVHILFKDSFMEYRLVLYILSAWLVAGILNNFIGIQYLTCIGCSKTYAVSIFIVGILTLPLMILLTQRFSCYGTASAILIGEVTLTFILLGNIITRKL